MRNFDKDFISVLMAGLISFLLVEAVRIIYNNERDSIYIILIFIIFNIILMLNTIQDTTRLNSDTKYLAKDIRELRIDLRELKTDLDLYRKAQ